MTKIGELCTQCGNEYKRIAAHWSKSSDCSYPSFTDQQKEIITGLLMGDGSINRQENMNPRLRCNMISKNYLQYIDNQFGVFGKGVFIQDTAEESAESARKNGFRPNAKAKNYHDLYRWQSMCHSELQDFADWYSTGEKVWPEEITLTPTVLKHWYCGDGNWHNSQTNNCIQIAMSNELNNTDKIDKLFKSAGLPSPSNYNISERKDGSKNCNAVFTVDQSKELWQYMGEPLPDFEYKWPEEYHS